MTRTMGELLKSEVLPEGGDELRLAAVDVGSNSLHMVIAQIDTDGAATTLWRMKEMVGLGRASFPSHKLSQEAMDRAVVTLRRFGDMARRRGCEKVVAVATSAVREAENGGDFIQRARHEAGMYVKVVSAKEEARLIYVGVRHAVDLSEGPSLILDVGGGSVELIVADAREAVCLESRKLGAARMTAQFINTDPPARKQVAALLQHYQTELEPLWEPIKRLAPVRAIGTSGTMENLVMMCRNGRRMEDGKPLELVRDDLDQLVEKLLESDALQRVKIKGLDEKRQDQILAGALLVQLVLKRLDIRKLVLCSSALREGILLEYVQRHLPDLAIRRKVPDPRRRSVLDLARRCEWNETHSLQVARIALRLFDELKSLHDESDQARELIEYAAILHDIGWHISSKGHHKHSMYLVNNGNLKGFGDEEVGIIASLARYHRKAGPSQKHSEYAELSRRGRCIVDVGAAILRIADGLDRSHCHMVSDLSCTLSNGRVKVELHGRGDMELELWAARRKTDVFSEVFGCAVTFKRGK